MGQRTPLYDAHLAAGARLVDFGGWDMPVHYGSQVEEHHAVRRAAGAFDVSHMCVVDLTGDGVRPFLASLLANDVGRLTRPGKALYSCMLREDGGVIDDLIVYFIQPGFFRLVVNAGTADKDLAWIRSQATGRAVEVTARRDLGIVAVQGPGARAACAPLLPAACPAAELAPFSATPCGDWFVARTGYTGEDGFVGGLPVGELSAFWSALLAAGVRPCGLGARDTLRLEAGMNLYGSDMDETVTPLESGLAWTVAFSEGRDFIGRAALEAQLSAGSVRRFVGLLLEDRGVLRSHQRVVTGAGDGEVTSGTFSPTLSSSIGLARLPAAAGNRVEVDIRGRLLPARIVKPPFVRHGRAMPGILETIEESKS
ncbi:MAG: glycine cleavage system aminomethyltransferase GcvT [Steroidobacteraceae bacterium]